MRYEMLRRLDDPLPAANDTPATGRTPRESDLEGLAALMLDAYRGTIDDEGGTLDLARAEVANVGRGDYGAYMPEASDVAVVGDEIVAATIVTRWRDEPLIAFSMTAATWKRRGLARASLVRALHRLRDLGESRVRLVVTAGNEPAERLYVSLGWERVG
ncbi:MAG: GNAT family N-acetyltransferase [Phycisphaerae bacterium]|nr:GNAT family N-acetyltransferase [Phycisphaerae bacterium]